MGGWGGWGRWLMLAAWGMGMATVGAFDHDHALYGTVLSQHVKKGLVNYGALKAGADELHRYLDEAAAVTRVEFDGWTEPRRLAFLINLYNASTLELVARHYPVGSIKDIGTFLRGPWKQECVRLWGTTTTLDHVEHDVLRRDFKEPRVHFALVCAARSCPPLRSEPFVGDRLEAQLVDQGREFLRQTSKNRVEPGTRTLFLSPIFQWFKSDFTASKDSVAAFVAPYLPAGSPGQLEGYRIRYTVYDWRLNDSEAK